MGQEPAAGCSQRVQSVNMSGQLRLWGRSRQERVETMRRPLVARCGMVAHLVPDTLLFTDSLIHHHPTNQKACIAGW